MANPELGAKQICPTCSTKFYDLGRRPAHCPKCGSDFDPEEALRNRRVRTRAPLPDDDAEEVKPAAELDEAVETEPLETGDDDDEVAAPTAPDDGLGVDFAEDEDLEDADDDEVPFIEDDEDDFSEDEIDGLPDEGGADD